MKRNKSQNLDPILTEVREAKDRLAARFGYDATSMLKDAQCRQARSKRQVVNRTKRKASA